MTLLKFVRPVANSTFDINNPYDLKLLTRLRLVFSHFPNHEFRHDFEDCINSICACGLKRKTTTHFLLPCRSFNLLDNPS